MPPHILIAYAGRHGSTAEVAQAIAEAVAAHGALVDVRAAGEPVDVASYDAVVLGSAVYFGKWLPEAVAFIERHRAALKGVPVAYFTTCLDLTRLASGAAPASQVFIDPALGHTPKRPNRLTRWERIHLLTSLLQAARSAAPDVHPVSLAAFRGSLDYAQVNLPLRLVLRAASHLKPQLAQGDFRDWDTIRSWAAGLGLMFSSPAPRPSTSAAPACPTRYDFPVHGVLPKAERRMYPGGRPNRLARGLNRWWAFAHGTGLLPKQFVTLEVRGRRTGKALSFALVMVHHEGERYLVSMLGENSNWVRNIEAAGGRATLRHGRRERVVLEPVDPEQRAPILRRYLTIAPGPRAFIPVDRRASLEEFHKIAPQVPVFRVRHDDTTPPAC